LNVIQFFIKKNVHFWNYGMFGAAKGGHLNLVEYSIKKGANRWNCGM
jgi:hypothetical protein